MSVDKACRAGDGNAPARVAEQDDESIFGAWYSKFESFRPKGPLLYSDLHCAWQAAIATFLERTGQYVTNDATREAALTEAYAEGRKDEAEEREATLPIEIYGTLFEVPIRVHVHLVAQDMEIQRLTKNLHDARLALQMVDDNNRAEAGEPVKSWRGSFVVEEVRRVLAATGEAQ